MFPRLWNNQRLVLIPKGKNAQEESDYRPLCVIDTAGKLFERIICRKLEAFLGEEGLSDRQFGFRKARSTIDATERFMTMGYDKGCHQR